MVKQPNLDVDRMAAIAEAGRAAGDALPPLSDTRSLDTVPYKYGHHLPNWFNGWSDGYRRELEATLPVSLTFLDNVKGEGLVQGVDLLHQRGVKPYLVFRPYFRPEAGVSPAIVQGYANGAVIRMRDDYFQHPLIKQAYEEGRFIVKLFNETNIGGEGFPRGRAGFADALRYWKQARSVVKAAYPNAKILSLCNTPGNDDVWFRTDVVDAPYWYHGKEAAQPNPTQAEIAAAIASCPFKEMFDLCDIIGIHVYANIRSTVDGDLATWYSRRHEQALKFLTPYTDAGKKMIINEWDMGYDDGQQYRAEGVVYGLATIVGPNDHILFINHWWNGDDGEGAATWEKHQTRKQGQLRPVVHAIKAFRENGTVPNPNPNPNPVPPPPPSGLPPRETVDLPEFVTITDATAVPNERFWRAVRVERRRESTSGGQHHIYHVEPHDPAVFMVVKVEGQSQPIVIPHDKGIGEPAANFPMFGSVYDSSVRSATVTKSDIIKGMRMPQNQHEAYHITWQLVTMPQPTPPPTPTPTPEPTPTTIVALKQAGRDAQAISPNPQAWLEKNAFAKGYTQWLSPEKRVMVNGIEWVVQLFRNPTTQKEALFFCKYLIYTKAWMVVY